MVSSSEFGSEYEVDIECEPSTEFVAPSHLAYFEFISSFSASSGIVYFDGEYDLFRVDANIEITKYIQFGYIFGFYDNAPSILVRKDSLIDLAKLSSRYRDHKVILCKNHIFFDVINHHTSDKNKFLSVYLQKFLNPKSNAFIFNSVVTRLKLLLSVLLASMILYYSGIVIIVSNMIYFIQSLFKLFIFKKAFVENIEDIKIDIPYLDIPIYTILVPLYREAAKVKGIIRAISNLNYPKNRLDVKLVIEHDDHQTYKAIRLLDLPDYIQVVRVPVSHPRTKPKACNYAMQFALGEFVVIYDAEDKPDSMQLLEAVKKFNSLPLNYACLQARLKIASKPNDLLAVLFQMEYDLSFCYIMKGLTILNLPVTLGGTSNHFRIKVLRELGYWDAYNVTEDADIGIRLNLKGYKVAMLNSNTIEEPVLSLKAWFKQRVRWIKGFIITFSTYLLSDKSNQNLKDKLSLVVYVGFGVLGFILAPVVFYLGFYMEHVSLYLLMLSWINIFLFLVFFWSAAYFLIKTHDIESDSGGYVAIAIFPLYFILHSIAAYFAIIEMFFAPFRWNKTDHDMQG